MCFKFFSNCLFIWKDKNIFEKGFMPVQNVIIHHFILWENTFFCDVSVTNTKIVSHFSQFQHSYADVYRDKYKNPF